MAAPRSLTKKLRCDEFPGRRISPRRLRDMLREEIQVEALRSRNGWHPRRAQNVYTVAASISNWGWEQLRRGAVIKSYGGFGHGWVCHLIISKYQIKGRITLIIVITYFFMYDQNVRELAVAAQVFSDRAA